MTTPPAPTATPPTSGPPQDVTVSFDQEAYLPGAPVTMTIGATGQDYTAAVRNVAGTITDPITGDASPFEGTFGVWSADALDTVVDPTATDDPDTSIEWTAGEVTQPSGASQAYSAVFTATAA